MATRRLARLAGTAKRLDRMYPDGKATLRAGMLRWIGTLQPSEVSAVYRVELMYRPPRRPSVFVRWPKLAPDDKGHLPHIYSDGSLCLYEAGQWGHQDRIDETVLPWACEWLLHYEFWRATGDWHGSGGNHTGTVHRPATGHSSGRSRRGSSQLAMPSAR